MSTLMDSALEAEELFELDELEGYTNIECPACRSINNRHESGMGQLGNVIYHRCRYCWVVFAEEGETT